MAKDIYQAEKANFNTFAEPESEINTAGVYDNSYDILSDELIDNENDCMIYGKQYYVTREMFQSYPDVLNVKDVMKMLDIGRNKTLELLKTSKIKSVIVGNKYRIPKINVINFLMNS